MQIILLEKVINLGTLGDVVRVKDGYARNFLIPQGKAKRANTANLADFEKRRVELEKAHAELLAQTQEKGAKLEGMMVQITQKAGVDGRLEQRGVKAPQSLPVTGRALGINADHGAFLQCGDDGGIDTGHRAGRVGQCGQQR